MLDATIRRIAASPLERLAYGVALSGINANVLTLFGFLMGVAAAVLIAGEQFRLAVVFLALNRLADVLDGMVARRSGATAVGAFLDASLDLFVYAAIPFGFGLAHQQDALAAAFLLMGLMVAVTPALAGRALVARTGGAPPVHSFALIGHSETFIAFVVMCLSPRWTFSPLAYFFGMLCIMSGAMRVISTVINLRAHAKS
jgi:phosphatidylglycerophosphate synthase